MRPIISSFACFPPTFPSITVYYPFFLCYYYSEFYILLSVFLFVSIFYWGLGSRSNLRSCGIMAASNYIGPGIRIYISFFFFFYIFSASGRVK